MVKYHDEKYENVIFEIGLPREQFRIYITLFRDLVHSFYNVCQKEMISVVFIKIYFILMLAYNHTFFSTCLVS